MKGLQVFTAICAVVLFCGLALAQDPVLNVEQKVHPNLFQAQTLVVQANKYIVSAQKGNPYDIYQGHADKARQLLVQANQELKAAAEAANAAAANKQGKK